MSKFTPGPWAITDIANLPDGGKWIDISDDAYAIPIVSVRSKDHDANAALIAAAPDMYEALDFGAQMTLHEMSIGEMADALREWQTVAKLVLSKAEGKQ